MTQASLDTYITLQDIETVRNHLTEEAEALNLLLNKLPDFKREYRDEVLLLQQKLNKNKRAERLKLLTDEEDNEEDNVADNKRALALSALLNIIEQELKALDEKA